MAPRKHQTQRTKWGYEILVPKDGRRSGLKKAAQGFSYARLESAARSSISWRRG
jgi:hypothetical protein